MGTIIHFNYLRKEKEFSKSEDLVSTMDIVPYNVNAQKVPVFMTKALLPGL